VTFGAFHEPFSFLVLVAKEYQFIKKESNIKEGEDKRGAKLGTKY
jgi:hypothetical protein